MIKIDPEETLRIPTQQQINLIHDFRLKCAYYRRGVYHMRNSLFNAYLLNLKDQNAVVQGIVEHANNYYQCMTNSQYGDINNPPELIKDSMNRYLKRLINQGAFKPQYEQVFDNAFRKLVYSQGASFPKP